MTNLKGIVRHFSTQQISIWTELKIASHMTFMNSWAANWSGPRLWQFFATLTMISEKVRKIQVSYCNFFLDSFLEIFNYNPLESGVHYNVVKDCLEAYSNFCKYGESLSHLTSHVKHDFHSSAKMNSTFGECLQKSIDSVAKDSFEKTLLIKYVGIILNYSEVNALCSADHLLMKYSEWFFSSN